MKYPEDLPFKNHSKIFCLLPDNFEGLSEQERSQIENLPKLINENEKALAWELGAVPVVVKKDPGTGARWYIGPARHNFSLQALNRRPAKDPEIFLDRKKEILITDGPDLMGVYETFSFLQKLYKMEGECFGVLECQSREEVVERIREEVRSSFGGFHIRDIDWDSLCDEYSDQVIQSKDPISLIQEWLSRLGDGHTWLKASPLYGELDYRVWTDGKEAFFYEIPEGTPAWQAGVRPGDFLLDESLSKWWKRTAATPHSKSLITGRRILSSPMGTIRQMKARIKWGKTVEWKEEVKAKNWEPLITSKKLPSGKGYLKIQAWLRGRDMAGQLDEIFKEFKDAPGLVVDLRGNPGGDLFEAQSFRNRFLRKSGTIGWIRHTLPDGSLGEKEAIHGDPAPKESRWKGSVTFLTDPATYSASEDALLGLQGLPHVKVLGEPSGGGSGRMRIIPLLPGWKLTISTALTFDLKERCLEGAGILVDKLIRRDYRIPEEKDKVLELAEENG